jgi:hypothetical protein
MECYKKWRDTKAPRKVVWLVCAIRFRGHPELVRVLLEHNVSMYGDPKRDYPQVVRLLLEHGGDPNRDTRPAPNPFTSSKVSNKT